MIDRASERGDSRRETLEQARSDDQAAVDGGIIELHLHDVTQLFDPMDPSPFQERDLNRIAEAHIVDGVKELPSKTACALVLHLDQSRGQADEERIAGDAIRGHFARQAKLLRRGLRSLIHRGLASLDIGLAFLIVLSIVAQSVDRLLGASAWAALLREGLLIVGWVAMWRPLEIFLYDWWPILGDRRLRDRLSRIKVRIVYSGVGPTHAQPPDDQSTKQAARAVTRWENEGGRTLPPDRRPRATK